MQPKTPQVQILAGTVDIGSKLAGRELTGTITDNGGEKADELHFSVSNYDGGLAKPTRGTELSVSLGYVETGLIFMGKFTVESVEKAGPVATFSITAHAGDFKKALKARKTRAFTDTTFGQIISTLAGEAGLTALCDPTLAALPVTHEAQTAESGFHFLMRLGRHFDAICKPANGNLIAVPRGTGTNGSGAAISAVTVTPNDLTEFCFTDRDRPAHGVVTAHYYDPDKATHVSVTAGSGSDPAYLHHDIWPDQASAQHAAKNHCNGFARKGKSFTGTMFGDPSLKAGGVLTTSGFGDDDDTDWIFFKAEHAFGAHGMTTKIEGHPKTAATSGLSASSSTTRLETGAGSIGSNIG